MADMGLDFQKIYDEFRPKVRRYLARLVGGEEADDLTQEVFIRVSRALKDFRGDSQLSTWIYRIATNAALDKFRSSSFQRLVSEKNVEYQAESDKENGDMSADKKSPQADQQLIRKEMNKCIRDVVMSLPEDYRAVVVLSDLEELRNNEIAGVLGISIDTVKIRLHRARARLKKKLETLCSFYKDERNEFACDLKSAFIEFRKKR